ncbi:MAG: hypothetical protein HFJ75_02415 [Eggerthellaceae bacterium]|nr:hypothetical protein [Eggerthellaceae bacterium]
MGRLKTTWIRRFSGERANLCLRVAVTLIGAVLVALGIALSKHAGMGTAAVSSLPAVVTDIAQVTGQGWVTMGMCTFALNLLCLGAEAALLGREFHPVQLLQFPVFLMLSMAVDGWLWALSFVPADSYVLQVAFLLLSIATLGLGISLQLAPNLVMSPVDAIVQVFSYKTGRPYSSCKVAMDVVLMTSAAALSLGVLGGLHEVREGTIIAALLVGRAVGLWSRALTRLAWVIPPAPRTFIAPLIPQGAPAGAPESEAAAPLAAEGDLELAE